MPAPPWWVEPKTAMKKAFGYKPFPDTRFIRSLIEKYRSPGFPFCPAWQGDFLYGLAKSNGCKNALEIGFATGSTALYILAGIAGHDGSLVSIDYNPKEFDCLGVKIINEGGFAGRHRLIEENTNMALPMLYKEGKRFDMAYLDGWKTFDHVSLDMYYVSRLLKCGGFMVFDDTRMPSVDKAIRLLLSHYAYKEVDYKSINETSRLRWSYYITTRSAKRPFRAFKKVKDENELQVTSDWNFWKKF